MARTTTHALLALVLVAGLTAASDADTFILTPPGIQPGQSFNVVIVDSVGGPATSSAIADYNNAIQTDAAVIKYPGGTISAWRIMGATPSDDPAALLFSSPFPVYDDAGVLLAHSGPEYLSYGGTPRFDQNGNYTYNNYLTQIVWTGLQQAGIPSGYGTELGGATHFTSIGIPNHNVYDIGVDISGGYGRLQTDNLDYYGYATFTAASPSSVPEPSTFILLIFGGVILCGAGRRHKCRAPASGVA